MITPLRSSSLRLMAGAGLAILGLGVFLLALPNAAQQREQAQKSALQAANGLKVLQSELEAYQHEAGRIQADRQTLDTLLMSMPAETVGHLHWKLSRRVFALAAEHEVHLVSVKYGAPSREGAKGSLLEALDVEFAVTGIFEHLKAFMLALEGSRLPFAVVSAKLDDGGPDGAHLTVVLRAFRQAPAGAQDTGEGA